jgi:hypothetical protein
LLTLTAPDIHSLFLWRAGSPAALKVGDIIVLDSIGSNKTATVSSVACSGVAVHEPWFGMTK